MFIADAHCDLLGYLQFNPNSSPLDLHVPCALPHLQKGKVGLQVMAIFTVTEPNSSKDGLSESLFFKNLSKNYADSCFEVNAQTINEVGQNKVGVLAAIENASGFCEETDSFEEGIRKLEEIQKNVGTIFYISFTHHLENRFGGGNYTKIGLKEDGKRLLAYLSGKKIAVDLAHTSDQLAEGILKEIQTKNLDVPVIASHSNFRSLFTHQRNLPDELVQEILKQKGIIGINWLIHYLGDSERRIYEQIEHAFKIGAENAISSGADLFFLRGYKDKMFFDEYQTASDSPKLLQNLEQRGLSQSQVKAFAHQNMLDYLKRLWA